MIRFVPRRESVTPPDVEIPDVQQAVRPWRRDLKFLFVSGMALRLVAAEAVLVAVVALAHHLGFPLPAVVAAVLAFLILVTGIVLAVVRMPDELEVALLLDRRLHLHDQLGTALDPAVPESMLTPLLRRRAAEIAARSHGQWKVRPQVGSVVVMLLVAVVAGGLARVLPEHAFTRSAPASGQGVALAPPPTPVPIPQHITIAIAVQTPPSHSVTGVSQAGHHPGALKEPYAQHAYRHTRQGSRSSGPVPPLPVPVYRSPSTSAAKGQNGGSRTNGGGAAARPNGNAGTGKSGVGASGAGAGSKTKSGSAKAGSGSGGAGARPGQNSASSGHGEAQAPRKSGGPSTHNGKAIANPYGPSPPFLRSLPKPGLIVGKQNSAPGLGKGNVAGSGAGGKGKGNHTPASGSGHRMVLPNQPVQSAGNSGTRQGTSSGSSNRAGHPSGGTAAPIQIDYVSPDEDPVSPSDGPFVQRYFSPQP